MKNLIVLLAFVLSISCNTSTKKSESSEQPVQERASERPIKPVAKKPTATPEFKKESLSDLVGTTWIHQPFPNISNCIDTLKISKDNGSYYHCEHELSYDLEYEITNDTLAINEYGFVSEVDAELGTEIKSMYKFIKSEGKLIMIFIGHKYNAFKPVEPKYLYKEFYTK